MSKTYKTQKRVQLLEEILKLMEEHEMFDEILSRRHDTEPSIQKALFSKLNKKLPEVISEFYHIQPEKAKELIKEHFRFEKKTNTPVHNFSFFATNHRPDAVLLLNDISIAFEVKKGDSGDALRAGIGQSLVYATQFDFVLYFFVDHSNGRDLRNASESPKEKDLIQSLWDGYNIKFIVV